MSMTSLRPRTAHLSRPTVVLAVLLALMYLVPPLDGAGAPNVAPVGPLTADAAADRFVIGFQPGTTSQEVDSTVNRQGGTVLQALDSIGARVVKLAPGRQLAATMNEVARAPGVRYVEPDYRVKAAVAPNDADFPRQWALQNRGQTGGTPGADIKATAAWNITTGSQNVVVGVVDTGADYLHPDLAANIWNAPPGWNLYGCGVGTRGYRAVNGVTSCDPMDDNNHGTHVSGAIGATTNNLMGVAGINWQVSIMPLKFLDSNGEGFTSDAVTVIDYAVRARQRGVNLRALNNSWGGTMFSQALLDEINLANANGILFIAAAGNSIPPAAPVNIDTTPLYPASYGAPNIIAVASTNASDGLSSFSNYGPNTVALGAPGSDIYSTTCAPAGGVCTHGYASFSGTSMATPHVTGVAALMLSAPGLGALSVATLRDCLVSSGDPLPALAGTTTSGRRLNAYQAIADCQAITAPTPAPPPAPTPSPAPAPSTAAPSWSAWSSQGGVLTDSPAATGFNGRTYVFARGSDNGLYVKSTADGASFTAWQPLGGVLTAAPAAATAKGQLYVFAKGSDNALYVKQSSDGWNYTDWRNLGGVLTAPPAAAGVNGMLYVFAKGADNALYMMRTADGYSFAGWYNLGGVLTAAPAATGFNDQVYVFAKGADNALYQKHSADGTTFTDWRNFGGVLTAAPAAAAASAGGQSRLYLFARGADGALYARHTSDDVTYTDWVSLGGQLVGPPAAASTNEQLFVFVRWSDDALYERHTLR